MSKLTDTTPMPFGIKYKGVPMQDVPVNYLHWYWENVSKDLTAGSVSLYIKENLDALKKENKDLIWSK
jgi:uncharacterized protein (DUF3820 family)